MLVHSVPSHMVCDTLWHHISHSVCMMLWKQREGKGHWELHRKSMHSSHDGPSNIHLPEAFLFLLNYSLVIQVYPRQTWIPGFHYSIHILLIWSHWQFLPSNNPELNAILPMYPCDVQKADLFSDLESLTQFYYCSPSWLLLYVAFPVTVYWPFRHFHMNQY